MNDENRDQDLARAWEKGKPAQMVRVRPATSVLSTRLPIGIFEQLSRRAEVEGKSVSFLARELIEQGLASQPPSTPVDVAAMFHRWTAELLHGVRFSTIASPAITRNSWVHFFSAAGASYNDLLTEIRAGEIKESSTERAGLKRIT